MPVTRCGPSPERATWLRGLHPAIALLGLLTGSAALLVGGWPAAVFLTALSALGLAAAGWQPAQIRTLLRPWAPVALLVVVIHLLTTTSAAPLGRPSVAGVAHGILAAIRLAGLVMGLALLQGQVEVADLVEGWTWLLWPLRGVGLPVRDLSLVLAVAVGTAPRTLDEGRRLLLTARLRDPAAGRWGRMRHRLWIVSPLLEGLARRAEALSLTLRPRHRDLGRPQGPGPGQAGLLILWLGLLALVATPLAGGLWP